MTDILKANLWSKEWEDSRMDQQLLFQVPFCLSLSSSVSESKCSPLGSPLHREGKRTLKEGDKGNDYRRLTGGMESRKSSLARELRQASTSLSFPHSEGHHPRSRRNSLTERQRPQWENKLLIISLILWLLITDFKWMSTLIQIKYWSWY